MAHYRTSIPLGLEDLSGPNALRVAQFVKDVNGCYYGSNLTVTFGEEEADPESSLLLMSLEVEKGDDLVVEGDNEEAVRGLADLLAANTDFEIEKV